MNRRCRCEPLTRRPFAGAALLFMIVFIAVWALVTTFTPMYGDAACMVSALAAGGAARRYLRPFVARGRR